jgi:hypothetical protein
VLSLAYSFPSGYPPSKIVFFSFLGHPDPSGSWRLGLPRLHPVVRGAARRPTSSARVGRPGSASSVRAVLPKLRPSAQGILFGMVGRPSCAIRSIVVIRDRPRVHWWPCKSCCTVPFFLYGSLYKLGGMSIGTCPLSQVECQIF